MNMKKLLALALALIMVMGAFAGCKKSETDPTGTTGPGNKEVVYQDIDDKDAVVHVDFTSVYEQIGTKITIDMVNEDPDTGLATVEYEGKTYDLGMDFLSWAMVYNCAVPEGGEWKTSEDVFNEWWKLYIQRWNYLVPEVPLYSNQYFDLYNAKIQNFVTTPYWAPADAIVAATIKDGAENSVILGSSTELSGAFRNSSWGKSSPAASDLDIQNLTSGFATIQTDKSGSYIWNMKALAEVPTAVVNDDGSLTYTIKVQEGMKFSDGSAITAKNYIAGVLGNSTAVSVAAGGNGTSGQLLVGYDEFKAYEGEGDTVYFEGVKLIDDYTFSVTFQAEYASYYYVMTYAGYSPDPMALYLGTGDIVVADNGACGLNAKFYEKTQKDGVDTFVQAENIVNNLKWNSKLPYSGPYVVSDYDASALVATLSLNPYYPGDDARGKASIETITYIKIVSETQTDMFKAGQVDVLAGITGGEETKAALALIAEDSTKYAETHYDRAGYGKIGFRADFGPTGMVEVRQAIMYTINRPEFAQVFTGGYGSVVHGPYYEGYSAFKAVKNEINLNQYTYSVDDAIAVLEEGGWIYNVKGEPFVAGTDDVRYKKLSGYELSVDNLHFATVDGKYKTVKIDGAYYMPLAINWYGTQPNTVTDQLLTAWQTNPNSTTDIGMYITYTSTDFMTGVYGELNRMEGYGYTGTPKLNAVNFATGFTSALYDYSWNWTIDPELWAAGYSVCFVADEADFWENYK
jgi:ABC-type transport system substrate-binding protein